MTRLTKHEKIKVTVAATCITLLIACPIVFLATGGWFGTALRWVPTIQIGNFSLGGGSDPTTLEEPIDREESFAAADVDDLHIDWKTGSIKIMPGEGDDIRISERVAAGDYQMDPRRATFTLEGRTLVIDDGLPDTGSIYPDMDLIVEVPHVDTLKFGGVDIQSVSSSIDIEQLPCDDLKVGTVSSDVTISDLRAQDASVDVVSGTVSLAGTVADGLDVATVSGGIYLTLSEALPVDISASSTSGGIELDVPDDAGFTLTADTLSGGFSSPLGLDTIASDGTFVNGDGACTIELATMSGSIRVA